MSAAPPDAPSDTDGSPEEGWLSQSERGQIWMIRMAFGLATLVGRRAMGPFVSLVALWYRLFDRKAVGHSKDWLTRVLGRPPSFGEVYRHLRCFAQVTLDKVFFLTGRTDALQITCNGKHHLDAQVASGHGAVLLGCHLGSYDAMRAVGSDQAMPIQILGYFENAAMINALISQLNPHLAERVIHLGSDPVGVMARVKDRMDEGEMVALMGDRVGLNDRIVEVDFMGQPAPINSGAFLLASLLKCPVYLVFGLHHEPNRYDLYCEPFAERIELPRRGKQEALQEHAQRFAERMEHHARRAPFNWFNFFDFWSRP